MRHHTVQKQYLAQWVNDPARNQLWVYSIPENKIIERGPDWKGFWRKDFNVLDKEGEMADRYIPEKVSAHIDTLGIDVIRRIKPQDGTELQGYDRCYLSFYIALQYIRTPRHREELDKFVEAATMKFMREDVDSPEKLNVSKKDLAEAKPRNDAERKSLERALTMTDEQLQKEAFEFLHGENMRVKLTNPGHSKSILKVDRLAREIFEVQWVFLVAPNDTSFITSDNPCYTVANQPSNTGVGIRSPNAMTFFPLRPDVCIALAPKYKSQQEFFKKLDKSGVREINQATLRNSYGCIVAKDKRHTEYLTEKYDYKNHRTSRDTVVREFGDYVLFSSI